MKGKEEWEGARYINQGEAESDSQRTDCYLTPALFVSRGGPSAKAALARSSLFLLFAKIQFVYRDRSVGWLSGTVEMLCSTAYAAENIHSLVGYGVGKQAHICRANCGRDFNCGSSARGLLLPGGFSLLDGVSGVSFPTV